MTGARNLDSMTQFLAEATRRYQAAQVSECSRAGTSPLDSFEFVPDLPERTTPEMAAAWERAAVLFAEGSVVNGIVTGWNRGGLLVRWEALQGFVPASQLRDVTVFECDQAREDKLARWVGEELSLKVIELDQHRNRLVFSERATVWGPRDGERLLAEIKPGDVRSGHVSNLCDFGAFVDLGGLDGLIHLSELSWRRVTHPRELLTIGQEVQVYVISLDRDNRRVALSLKRLRPNPWSMIDRKYALGQVIPATITNVVDFGAFAQIEEGLEGLIHISELADELGQHPSEIVCPGDQVQVRILRIDSTNHRLGLSMKQVAPRDQPGATDAIGLLY